LDSLINFFKHNIIWIAVIVLVVVIALIFIQRSRKKELKPISRSEIERKRFIERNELNKTSYKWLYRGNELIGKILRLRYSNLDEFKKNKDKESSIIIEMVVKPALFNLVFWKPVNPFAKEICIFVDIRNMVKDRSQSYIEIDEKVGFDVYLGLTYDRSVKDEAVEYIRIDSQFRTDLDALASIYFAKAQEQATIVPQNAIEMALREKDLQTELAKKRGKQSSI
jgi:hypothetical protein